MLLKLIRDIAWFSQVPDAIKSQYQNPPTLMAPAGIREGELICTGLPEAFVPQHLASEDEQCQVCIRCPLFTAAFGLKIVSEPVILFCLCFGVVAQRRHLAAVQHYEAFMEQTNISLGFRAHRKD